MRTRHRIALAALVAVALIVLGAGAFFGARSRSGGQAAASNAPSVAQSDAANVSAAPDTQAAGADPYVYQYAGEFLCGDTQAFPGIIPPLGPGVYKTEIGVHNANSVPVYIQKKAVPMPLALPEQEGFALPRVRLALHEDNAFQIDCNDIMNTWFPPAAAQTCNGGPQPQPPNAFCKGYVIVEAAKPIGINNVFVPAALDVTITITVTDANGITQSLDFELQPGKLVSYPCWSPGPPFSPQPCP